MRKNGFISMSTDVNDNTVRPPYLLSKASTMVISEDNYEPYIFSFPDKSKLF